MGQTATKAECDAMLIRRLDEFGDKIEACAPALKTASPYVYVSHLSLAYNIGAGVKGGKGGYCASSVARKLQAGDVRGSCDALLLYRFAGGRVVKGLERRRQAERANCLKGI
jgi:lysozyme